VSACREKSACAFLRHITGTGEQLPNKKIEENMKMGNIQRRKIMIKESVEGD